MNALLARIPNHTKVEVAAYLLVPFAFIGGAFLALNFKTVTVTRTVHVGVPLAAASAAKVAQAWGKPDQAIPGAQVNQNLSGVTCYLWQSKRALLCF